MVKGFDVIIIGGGVVGCAIARELSKYNLKIGLLEKNLDVGYETSGRNTGVCHGGFAYDVGSLKAKLCLKGNQRMGELAKELSFPFKRCGKVLVGNTQEDYDRLLEVIKQGEDIGVSDLHMIDDKELHQLIPGVLGNFALLSPNSGILDPFQMTIALAENAAQNGVRFFFGQEVTGIQRIKESIPGSTREDIKGSTKEGIEANKKKDIEAITTGDIKENTKKDAKSSLSDSTPDTYLITTPRETFQTRWVINSAGLGCGKISDLLGITGYQISYSKDDYILLDQRLGKDVPMPIYTVPSNTYMGIHVTLTTDGNLLLGPTAETQDNDSCYAVEQKNIDFLYKAAMEIWPHFTRGDYIRTYCGILPRLVDSQGRIQDFKIEVRDDIAPRAVNLVGIESPGLTASPAIAEYVCDLIKEREELLPNPEYHPTRKSFPRFSDLSREEQALAIQEDPNFGEIICRCQKITKAEILSAIHNPLGVSTVTGIKYRTRAMMGRCQGGYCQMRITQLLEEELGLSPEEITYSREGSQMLYGKVRG